MSVILLVLMWAAIAVVGVIGFLCAFGCAYGLAVIVGGIFVYLPFAAIKLLLRIIMETKDSHNKKKYQKTLEKQNRKIAASDNPELERLRLYNGHYGQPQINRKKGRKVSNYEINNYKANN